MVKTSGSVDNMKGGVLLKLNLDQQFLDLKGFPLPAKMDDTLANELALSTIGKPAKMITWAVNLINNGEIEVVEEELEFLKKFIQDYSRLTNLAKAQLLERIDKLRG